MFHFGSLAAQIFKRLLITVCIRLRIEAIELKPDLLTLPPQGIDMVNKVASANRSRLLLRLWCAPPRRDGATRKGRSRARRVKAVPSRRRFARLLRSRPGAGAGLKAGAGS